MDKPRKGVDQSLFLVLFFRSGNDCGFDCLHLFALVRTFSSLRQVHFVHRSIIQYQVQCLSMEGSNLKWAYDNPEDVRTVRPEECRQYRPPIPSDVADSFSDDPRTLKIMDLLEWRKMTAEELESAVPSTSDLLSRMVEARIVRQDVDGYTLDEAYYNHIFPLDSDELYWLLTFDKREWGLYLKDVMESLCMRLIAIKFGTTCDPMNDISLYSTKLTQPLDSTADSLFEFLASVLTDMDPVELFENWTRKTPMD